MTILDQPHVTRALTVFSTTKSSTIRDYRSVISAYRSLEHQRDLFSLQIAAAAGLRDTAGLAVVVDENGTAIWLAPPGAYRERDSSFPDVPSGWRWVPDVRALIPVSSNARRRMRALSGVPLAARLARLGIPTSRLARQGPRRNVLVCPEVTLDNELGVQRLLQVWPAGVDPWDIKRAAGFTAHGWCHDFERPDG